MTLEDHGLILAESGHRRVYDRLVEALTDELGAEFAQAMNWWCGIGAREYELAFWKVLVALDSGGEAQAVIGLYQEIGAPADEFWVGWFGVHPALRGKGIGSLLVDIVSAEARARGGSVLRLYTEHDNERAISLYEHIGFRKTGTMAGHGPRQAGSKGTEIIMSKAL